MKLKFKALLVLFSLNAISAITVPDDLGIPTTNDDEVFSVLYGLNQDWPNLFKSANDYRVNTLNLIKEQNRLREMLLRDANYINGFEGRRYLSLKVAANEDITVHSQQISFLALKQLMKTLFDATKRLRREQGKSLRALLKETMERERSFVVAKLAADEHKNEIRNRVNRLCGSKYCFASANTLAKLFKSSAFRKKPKHLQLREAQAQINKLLLDKRLNDDEKSMLTTLQNLNDVDDIKRPLLGLEFDDLTRDFFTGQIRHNEMGQEQLHALSEKIAAILANRQLTQNAEAFFNAKQREIIDVLAIRTPHETVNPSELDKHVEVATLLGQLYVVLEKYHAHFGDDTDIDGAFGRMDDIISHLTEDDATFFADVDALAQPLEWFKDITPFVHRAFAHVAQQKRNYVTHANEGDSLLLQEIEPYVSSFRGIIAGDCSSKFSFPYPFYPDERIFVIRASQDSEPLGIVSSTMVDIPYADNVGTTHQKKALYLITIAGKQLEPNDVELVIRGFVEAKSFLGVDEIVIPEKSKLQQLINHTKVFGVYYRLSDPHRQVAIAYRDPTIRSMIEKFESPNNTGRYDHMVNNTHGCVVMFDVGAKVKVVSESRPARKQRLVNIGKQETFEFALMQHLLGNYDAAQAILASSKIAGVIREDVIAQGFAVIDNRTTTGNNKNHDGHQTAFEYLDASLAQNLCVDEHREAVRKFLASVGIHFQSDHDLDTLLYRGRLRAPDAFSDQHRDKTTSLVVQDCVRNEPPLCGTEFFKQHVDDFSPALLQPLLQKIWRFICGPYEQMQSPLVFYYFLVKPRNSTLSEIEKKKLCSLDESIGISNLVEIIRRHFDTEKMRLTPERVMLEDMIYRALGKDIIRSLQVVEAIPQSAQGDEFLHQLHQRVLADLQTVNEKMATNNDDKGVRKARDVFERVIQIFPHVKNDAFKSALTNLLSTIIQSNQAIMDERMIRSLILFVTQNSSTPSVQMMREYLWRTLKERFVARPSSVLNIAYDDNIDVQTYFSSNFTEDVVRELVEQLDSRRRIDAMFSVLHVPQGSFSDVVLAEIAKDLSIFDRIAQRLQP